MVGNLRPSHAAASTSTYGQILIAGGYGVSSTLNSIELYDPGSNSFAATTPAMNATREYHTAALIASGPNAGKVLLAGGLSDRTLASAEVYDPAANTFAVGPNMNAARDHHTATVISSGPNAGKILLAGGEDRNYGMISLASTELYDPVANKFAVGPTMNDARYAHTATVIASGPNAGRILLAGGFNTAYGALTSTELYDPAANKFAVGPEMNAARFGHSATVIASGPNAGKILLAGGFDGNDSLSSTEIYDPAAGKIALGPTLNAARRFHTATGVASGPNAGKILLAGGLNSKGPMASTEIYDPATNKIAIGPDMIVARDHHTATAIVSGSNAGKILLAGGDDIINDTKPASTELYDPAANKFTVGHPMNVARAFDTVIQLPASPSSGRIAGSP
jgi:Galactose oxidase, central domain/Kelch motif